MESDDEYRLRLLAAAVLPTHKLALSYPGYPEVVAAIGRDLGILRRMCTDPFGDAVRAAQARGDAVIPHPVQRIETEAEKEALWRSVEEYGRGG